MTLPDPSTPLTNKRHEQYAFQRAKGVDQATSWQRTIPFGQPYTGGNGSLRVSGHRCEQRPEVRERIDWLILETRNALEDAPVSLSRSDVIAMSLEVGDALEAAYRAAVTSSVSPQAIERLKGVWAAHLARQGKMDANDDQILPDPNSGELTTLLANMGRVCTCQKH